MVALEKTTLDQDKEKSNIFNAEDIQLTQVQNIDDKQRTYLPIMQPIPMVISRSSTIQKDFPNGLCHYRFLFDLNWNNIISRNIYFPRTIQPTTR